MILVAGMWYNKNAAALFTPGVVTRPGVPSMTIIPPSPVYKIYALIDPRTDEVRYVGFTCRDLSDRLYGHVKVAKEGYNAHCSRWIRQLLSLDIEPHIMLLEKISMRFTWQEREKFWIRKGKRLGWQLTNMTEGGDGVIGITPWSKGRHLSLEHKQRLSDSLKGYKFTTERCLNISIALTGKKHDAERNERKSKRQTGKKRSEECCKHLSEALKLSHKKRGHKCVS
jgi:hypothetical protein